MKTNKLRRKSTSISKTRWVAYAVAGAATALAGSHSAEAAIHYSGILNVSFPPHKDRVKTFPLDQAGDFISFERAEVGNPFFDATDIAYFRIFGIAAASFQADRYSYRFYVFELPRGQNISDGPFTHQTFFPSNGGIMASGHPFFSHWGDRGTGYVGFRFNNGAGLQYGWARVWVSGQPENAFKVLDYAYADPGERIRAGQTSSDEQSPDQGSLGWLALGAVGLLAWRKSRSRPGRV